MFLLYMEHDLTIELFLPLQYLRQRHIQRLSNLFLRLPIDLLHRVVGRVALREFQRAFKSFQKSLGVSFGWEDARGHIPRFFRALLGLVPHE